LPLLSNVVSVTVLLPRFEQLNEFGITRMLSISQLSVEPLFTCAGVMLTVPAEFTYTVIVRVVVTGRIVSRTVTVAVALLKLPLLSNMVSVTVLLPRFEQSNILGTTCMLSTEQLSFEPLFTCAGVMLIVPAEFTYTVILRAVVTGRIVSKTLTVAVALLKLPLLSNVVSVTLLLPRFVQLNVFGTTRMLSTAQLSVEPLFTCAGVMLTVPAEFTYTVIVRAVVIGRIVSKTVTVAVALLKLPLLSNVVSVTVLLPRFEQLNEFGITRMLSTAQLSVEPLFTCAGVMLTVPAEFTYTVIVRVVVTGRIVSKTVTVAVALLKLPLLSNVVSVTVLLPRFEQLNEFGITRMLSISQLSVEPLFTCAGVMLTVPDEFT
jgi:hypothetical protein